MKKINFKQPKYIFPAIVAVPIIGLAYFLWQLFGGDKPKQPEIPVDQINSELPEANVGSVGDKLSSMTARYNKDNAFTEIETIGTEIEMKENLDAFTDDEIDQMIAEAERKEQERRIRELEQQLEERQYNDNDDEFIEFENTLDRINKITQGKLQELTDKDTEPLTEAENNREIKDQFEPEKEDKVLLVEKANAAKLSDFNTISLNTPNSESPLIRAMIDQTTKAHEGTRLRFKLLDDVIVDNIKLNKGTYLYGTVKGFNQQRVMASVTSILVDDRFLPVDLSVFDNDGMEGFYVPSSSFRDFLNQAGSDVAGTNVQFTTGGDYGSGLNGEYLALQALQSIYQSATGAISANIKKNKAKIKYNTIVYLINSKEARK